MGKTLGLNFTSRSVSVAFAVVALVAILAFGNAARAAVITWDNSDADNDYTNASNWVGNVAPAGNDEVIIDLAGANKAVLSSGSPANVASLRIGYNGTDGDFEQTGGTLSATVNASSASRVGRNGETGTWTMSGGTANVNALQLGLNGIGTLTQSGGDMIFARTVANASLIIGFGGTGTYEISGGTLISRANVLLGDGDGDTDTFKVIGSAATVIGIGSNASLDGGWTQDSNGLLSVLIDTTATGVSKIFIDEVDGDGGTGNNGDVTFEAGSLLDVDFLGTDNFGTFTVMEWEGSVTDNGLAFAPGVNTSIWSFNVDASSKVLTVTAIPEPSSLILMGLGGLFLLRRRTA